MAYTIYERIATISENPARNFALEVNLISWNGAEPKLDIRRWDKITGEPLKGLTLSKKELQILKEVLKDF